MITIAKIVKMDFAICRKSILIMTISMILTGIGCLFYFTPLLLGFFVVGATAVVSSVFAVENKSNMEFFYGCLPIKRYQYVIGRSITCLLTLTIPSIISIIFIQIGMHFSFCRNEEIKLIMGMEGQYQGLIVCAMIMLGLFGGANLLLASYTFRVESREIMEVLLLGIEGVIAGIIVLIIRNVFFDGNNQAFGEAMMKMVASNEAAACIIMICMGVLFLFICAALSVKRIGLKTSKG